MKKIILIPLLFLAACTYSYEVCEQNSNCNLYPVSRVAASMQTFNVCNDKNICEKVPINRLLYKGGTDKKQCSNAPFLPSDYVDNWWNSEGLIDECEMPVNANMQFIFKQHNQTTYSHTGTIQIAIGAINYESDYKALQVFTGEDNNQDQLPDEWAYCGNVDKINGINTRVIHCKGIDLKFIKLTNADWNKGSLYLDYVEVLRIGG